MSRICFILPQFVKQKVGGAELQAYYIAQELVARGWEVFYICENRHPDMPTSSDGIKIITIPHRYSYTQWRNYRALDQAMGQVQADVWYCRSAKVYPVLVSRLARKWGGISVWAASRDNHTQAFVPKERHPAARLLERFSHQIYLNGIQYTRLVLAQNKTQQENLRRYFGVEAQQLYNAHPLPPLKAESGYAAREPLVAWVARLQAWKRPELFVELAQISADSSAQFMVVGPVVYQPSGELVTDAATKLENLSYVGEVPVEEVNELFWKMRVFVNTSLVEGFPNTFIQAWMRGVPVVSMGVDPDDLIKTHGLGKVVGTVEEMKAAVSQLLFDQPYWEEASKRCRAFAEQHFEIGQMTSRLLQLIDEAAV